MNGNEIIILVDGVAIFGTKSDEIQVGCETIPISSPSTGDWTAAIAGRKSWAITVGFLVSGTPQIYSAVDMVGTNVIMKIKYRTGTTWLEGTAICTTFKVTATKLNLVQGSFAFQGNGPLQMVEPE